MSYWALWFKSTN